MDWAMSRPGLQDPAVPVRRRVPRPRGAGRHRPPPGRVLRRRRGPQGARPRRRPGRQGALRRGHRGPGRPQEHRPDGRAVHRRLHAGRGGRRAARAVAHRAARPPSTCWARRRWSAPRPTATRRGCSSCSRRSATAAPSWAPDDLLERDDLGPLPRVNVSIKPTALATHYEPLSRREGIDERQGADPPDPAAGARPRRPRALRHGALRRQGPHAGAVPRAPVRGRVRRRRRRHRHPGLPARLARRPRRPHRLVGRPSHARSPCGW